MKNIYILLLSLLMPIFSLAVNPEDLPSDPLEIFEVQAPYSIGAGQNKKITFKSKLHPAFHAYAERLKITAISPTFIKVGNLNATPVIEFLDQTDQKRKMGIHGETSFEAILEIEANAPIGEHKIELKLTYQACSETFCLLPKNKTIQFVTQIETEKTSSLQVPEESTGQANIQLQDFVTSDFQQILQKGLFWTFLIVFIGGILTSFTPCIFPMIPITLAVLGRGASERSRTENFLLALSYVLGIAMTYSTLGVVAASTGALFGSALQNTWVVASISIIFFAMSLSMYGLYEIQPPRKLREYFNTHNNKGGFAGAFVTGLISGIVASPCVGPILVGILTYVAQTQNKTLGFSLLFVYALGLGQIFLFLGLTNNFSKLLPKSGQWMNAIKFVFGSLMLGVAYYYLSLALPSQFFLIALGVGLIILSSVYGAFLPNEEIIGWKKVQKGIMLATLMIGVLMIGFGIFEKQILAQSQIRGPVEFKKSNLNWQVYSEKLLQESIELQKPVVIDFYADWCAACLELEQKTFSDPEVEKRMQQMTLLKINNTESNSYNDQIIKKYGVVGLPTIIFIQADGVIKKELTLTEFESAEGFLKRLNQLTKQN